MPKFFSTAALLVGGALLLSGCATTSAGTNFSGYSQFQGMTYGELAQPGDCASTPGICGKMTDASQPFTRTGPFMPR